MAWLGAFGWSAMSLFSIIEWYPLLMWESFVQFLFCRNGEYWARREQQWIDSVTRRLCHQLSSLTPEAWYEAHARPLKEFFLNGLWSAFVASRFALCLVTAPSSGSVLKLIIFELFLGACLEC
jgi:hypothetical protein